MEKNGSISSKIYTNENYFTSSKDIAYHRILWIGVPWCQLFDVLTPQSINLHTSKIPTSIIINKIHQLDPKKETRPDSVPLVS